jgi:uncharacterized membrane protein
MKKKTIEKIITKAGVWLLICFVVACLLGLYENFTNTKIPGRDTKADSQDIWIPVALMVCILIVFSSIVSIMLNVSRIADAAEQIAEKNDTKSVL